MKLFAIIPERLFIIKDFLSPAECAEFIAFSEKQGYEDAPLNGFGGAVRRPDVRNNDRVIVDDKGLAVRLWEKLALFAPNPLHRRLAIGLNERFRFYRYGPGQRFAPHFDGAFTRRNDERSQVTFMVYLNQGCAGGETRFILPEPFGETLIVPRQGHALCFAHDMLHEGMPVTQGQKYVLRSDIMYSAEKSPAELAPYWAT